MKPRRLMTLLALLLALAATGCGGGGGGQKGQDNAITFWVAEDNAERVKAMQQTIARFQ